MIRVADGETLQISQKDIRLDGWAVESRLYAEDPFRGFLPSIGRLTRYRPPKEGRSGDIVIRNDTGVCEGSEITMFYDPMIAKLCSWAPDRPGAIDAMSLALDQFLVDGIEHNIPFLSALMEHPRWREGRLSTNFIAEEFPDGFKHRDPDEEQIRVLAAAGTSIELLRKDRLDRHHDRLAPHGGKLGADWVAKIGETYFGVKITAGSISVPLEMEVSLDDGAPFTITCGWRPGEPLWCGSVAGREVAVQVRSVPNGVRLSWNGVAAIVRVVSPRIAQLDRLMPVKAPPDTSRMLLCPMPGLVVSIAVSEGQEVKAGETLAVVEAMKMENILRAERDLTIARINAKPGDSLAVDAVIMEYE
jgi:propionyl-CoA carboxylase alpha chain